MIPGVYQATSFTLYTPSNNILPKAWCVMYLDADSTVSFVDKDGNVSTNVALPKGYQPFLVQKITSCTGGNVYILTSNSLN